MSCQAAIWPWMPAAVSLCLVREKTSMAAPDQAAVAAQGAAADLAMGDVGLTGSTALAEPTLLDIIVCEAMDGLRGAGEGGSEAGRRCGRGVRRPHSVSSASCSSRSLSVGLAEDSPAGPLLSSYRLLRLSSLPRCSSGLCACRRPPQRGHALLPLRRSGAAPVSARDADVRRRTWGA